LVSCDYFRTSVVFQGPDIYNIVGDIPSILRHDFRAMTMINQRFTAIRLKDDITGSLLPVFIQFEIMSCENKLEKCETEQIWILSDYDQIS